ncbi:long-chain-fatty-acid--CoA ligase [Paracidovorax avenae]|uniref:long-chain-fatty-acid--CoA ligase n=1 Tax=Paracidovorax avenae TaxID=80867 RepID=UPI000D21A194|nr:long-chain-fatty-acid--CoA ligase [Paracidovorax avenae]AVS83381.1 o-succinylbenzoate--CoA ligase [Paracidovorax avenae]AVT01094.1 o-succinylbenzoate--CoA ligase [Paracidovorax avenae]AVT08098.1 o-succinylbenzoate--CoA ligase [Paracidovorax avenae]
MSDPGRNDLSLLDALQRHLQNRPDRVAYRWGARTWTFRQVEEDTNRIANALAEQGIGPGDRVACMTRHHVPFILLAVAAMKAGAVCMPVNWRLAPAEAEYIIAHGCSRLLMVDAAFAAPYLPGGSVALPADCTVVCTDGAVSGAPAFDAWHGPHARGFRAVAPQAGDSAMQIYTSGTTGLPKGAVLSHRGLLSAVRAVVDEWHFGADGVLGNPLPTFHVAGILMLLLTLHTGGTTVACSDFEPDGFIASLADHRVTHAFLVPAMLLFMLQSPAARTTDFSALELIAYGGSPVSETLLQQAMATFQCDFLQVYGLTEVSGPATFLSQADHRRAATEPQLLRSAGRPVGQCRLRIVDPVSLQDVPEGQTGEIWLESVRNLKEYWRDEAATQRAFPEGRDERGGWLRTGDGGYLQDGYLYIHDRIKDMVISGGENIYPAEIENLLAQHPAVADGAVVGVPDATWGEAVKACVVLRPGAQASEREIIDWMRERLAHYKCPRSVDFLEALPRNPSGKILKRVLRAPYWKGQQRSVA